MVVTIVARMEPPIMGGGPTLVCIVKIDPLGLGPIGPVEGIPVMIGGMDMGPLLRIPLERGQDVYHPWGEMEK